MAGIYLHIPFCKQACSYCDFYFITSLQYRDAFVDRLVKEIVSYRGTPFNGQTYETIYLGGGTPSVLTVKQIDRILQALHNTFEIEAKEVTMEMNPDNVSAGYLEGLLEAGIDRASMGVQSFDPELLEFMHRAHNREEALECFELLSKTGFPSYSVDLIYGNPDQSLEQLKRDIDQLLAFDPPHVSAYSLTIESETRLGKQHELGRLDPLPDEEVAEHYDVVVNRLKEADIFQYEVSNFSKKGWEAVHNSGYWSHKNYLGMGPGAHSFWWPEQQPQAVRWENKPDIRSYLSEQPRQAMNGVENDSAQNYCPTPVREEEYLDLNQLAEERIMMGLRTRSGVPRRELEQRYSYSLNENQRSYLINKKEEGKVRSTDPVQLTHQGLKIADSIILDLITLGEKGS